MGFFDRLFGKTPAVATPNPVGADEDLPPADPSPMAAKHTVLVFDDEPDVVRGVRDLLRLDYRVLGANTLADAMRILEQEEVHVIMADQLTPEMSGTEFLSQLRGEHPEAVRLLVTGYADMK